MNWFMSKYSYMSIMSKTLIIVISKYNFELTIIARSLILYKEN